MLDADTYRAIQCQNARMAMARIALLQAELKRNAEYTMAGVDSATIAQWRENRAVSLRWEIDREYAVVVAPLRVIKPRAWRRYYGYRPATLTEQGRSYDSDIRRQEGDYKRWLMAKRKWSATRAAKHIAAQSDNRAPLHAEPNAAPNVRAETYISGGVIVRTVRCHSSGRQLHYGMDGAPAYLAWHKLPTRPDAPTTYAVLIAGKCVDRFLRKSDAMRKATALAATRSNLAA